MVTKKLSKATKVETKIKLKNKEIDSILDFINPLSSIPEETALSIQSSLKNKFKKQLKGKEIYPSLISKLKKELEKQFYSSQIQAGECVGIMTAQSIGERQTQMTLNSFHSAGTSIKTVIAGVPRFTEILSSSKEPKNSTCTIYFNSEVDTSSILSLRKAINHTFQKLTFRDVITRLDIVESKDVYESWYPFYYELMDLEEIDTSVYTYCIRLKLNMEKIYEFLLPLEKIRTILEGFGDIRCIVSPPSIGLIDVFLSEMEKVEGDIIEHIEDVYIPFLEKRKICGIDKIQRIYFEKDDSLSKKESIWFISTQGTNLSSILSHPLVDTTKTVSDSVWEIYNLFGIEATREYLIEEIEKICSSDGSFINSSHIKLLVDIICFGGKPISISRYGLKEGGNSTLSNASFEESTENFIRGAVYSESNEIKGVSESIMLACLMKSGSGICDILMKFDSEPEETKLDEVSYDY